MLACGPKMGQGVDPTPPWSTAQGKEQAKTELAEALLESGNPEAALRLIGKMRDQGSKGPDLLVLQGKALVRLGLTDDAETILTQVARRHPNQSEAHNQLGILLMDGQRIDEAISRFKSATRAAPRDGDAHNNLGFALMAAGRHEDAVKALRKALAMDSSKLRTRNNLGFALVATNQDNQAWRVFRAGADTATAHTNLALAQELRGDLEAAKKSYEKALQSDPGNALARQALSRLTAKEDKFEQPAADIPNPSEVSSPLEEESP